MKRTQKTLHIAKDVYINENSLFKIGESAIHGKGVIAMKHITEGQIIGTPLSIQYYVVVDITQDLGIWLNHSWCANSRLVKRDKELKWDLVALKHIKKGDEITMDYRDTPWFIAKPYTWYI